MKASSNVARFFVISAQVMLLVAVFSKTATIFTHFPMLDLYDPIFWIPNRQVLLGVSGVELIILWGLCRSNSNRFKGLLLLWLSGNFLLYRLALQLNGAGTPCPCLGSIGSIVGLGSSQVELVTRFMVALMLLGGVYLFWCDRPVATVGDHRSAEQKGDSKGLT